MVPNRPRPDNPHRSVRVENELWTAAQAKAKDRGEVLSEEIRKFLERYVRRG